MSHTGGCGCGAVRFEAQGTPLHTAYCHCEDCRRATGAPVALWVGFAHTDVTITGGTRERAGRGRVTRSFCADCGTPLTYRDADIPAEEVYLSGGTFDEPARLKPERHAYWSERVPYMTIADDLPKFASTSRQRTGGVVPEPIG